MFLEVLGHPVQFKAERLREQVQSLRLDNAWSREGLGWSSLRRYQVERARNQFWGSGTSRNTKNRGSVRHLNPFWTSPCSVEKGPKSGEGSPLAHTVPNEYQNIVSTFQTHCYSNVCQLIDHQRCVVYGNGLAGPPVLIVLPSILYCYQMTPFKSVDMKACGRTCKLHFWLWTVSNYSCQTFSKCVWGSWWIWLIADCYW